MVAKCVARGLSNTHFQSFFRIVAARGEGNQDGFSLWHYRDSIVIPATTPMSSRTLAAFLADQGSYLGYSYNTDFFKGHLVRYIPNLAIGIAIWDTTQVRNYVFDSNLKVAVIPSTYYTDETYGGVSTLYTQAQVSSAADVDNANYDFVYVVENDYYELFKASNNKSLDGDKTVIELNALPENEDFESDFENDASGTTYRYRFPGVETIGGTNCFLVDKFQAIAFYSSIGGGDPTGDPPGDPGEEVEDRGTDPCTETSSCERDGLNDYERVRFVQMVVGNNVKKFGCGIFHNKCTFAITAYYFTSNSGFTAALAGQKTKIVPLWRKGLKNGLWIWWNDLDNAFINWDYCKGFNAELMEYGVIGKNPKSGIETTTGFGYAPGKVKFKVGVIELELPTGPSFSWSRKKTNKDYDFGETEDVYYCDPCTVNNGDGQTYSTGSIRLRIREGYE